ncbi:hypothetical protein [Escherichia sp. E2748]|uniref:hypothetical protein n=1 Tax=Escherichia sp. E2748 TaxID=2044460 RepID=UPI001F0F0AE0|nr:hypothetical protein [Escherichia sp. E2748]
MRNINISSYIILIIFGMIILAMRYTTPIINPWLYAEDGVWVANALNHGWLETFINAREDYFVFFNIFFLFCININQQYYKRESIITSSAIPSYSIVFFL